MTRRGVAGWLPGRTWTLASATDALASLAGEALVVAHDELRLHLGHRVYGHAHDDQERGAAEVEVEPQPFRDPAQVVVGEPDVQGRTDHGDGRHPEARDEEL